MFLLGDNPYEIIIELFSIFQGFFFFFCNKCKIYLCSYTFYSITIFIYAFLIDISTYSY